MRSVSFRVRPWLTRSVLLRVGPWLTRSVLVCGGLWLVFVSVAAAERPHFVSKGPDKAITVDGNYDDWYGALQPFGADPVAIQFLNDGEFLYVRLTASDPGVRRQIVRQGMTVWFDPGGGTKKKFGVRYPVVLQSGPDAEGRGGPGGRRGRRGEGPPPDEDGPPRDRVDIIGPGKDDARSMTRSHLSGLEVTIRPEQGTLQYELKVPLAKSADHPYAIETAPGKTIGVGVETEKMQQRSFGTDRGGGFGGGGGGGGMGGGGRGRGGAGGMGGRGGGGRRGGTDQRQLEPLKPLKTWGTVAIGPVR
jgi:hypothetical protein